MDDTPPPREIVLGFRFFSKIAVSFDDVVPNEDQRTL
jgi:hypothetical protein